MIAAEASTRTKKLRILLSLINDDNDYQIEQTSAARHAARKMGVDFDIIYAGNDGIVQSWPWEPAKPSKKCRDLNVSV
jgi:hypothetical protein